MWRRTNIVVAILCGIVAGGVVALKSDRVAHNLKVRLERLIESQYGTRAEIDQLTLELLPPAVSLHRIRLQALEPGAGSESVLPWISLHSVRVRIRPWPSPAGAVVVDHLELDGLRAEFDITDRSFAAGGGAAATPMKLPFDIRELLVWNTSVTLVRDGERLELEGADFAMWPDPNGGRSIAMTVHSAAWEKSGNRIPFEMSGRGRLQGSLDRPEAVEVDRLALFLTEVRASVAGRIDLIPEANAHLALQARGHLARASELGLADLPEISGLLALDATLTGTFDEPSGTVVAEVQELKVARKLLGNVQLEATADPSRIRLEAFKVDHPQAGTVTGSGNLELAGRKAFAARARLHRVSLPGILDLAGLPDAWVRLLVRADVEATGKLMPFALSGTLAGKVTRFQVLGESYRSRDAEIHMDLADVIVEGPFRISPSGVQLEDFWIQAAASEVTVNGGLSFDPTVGLDLHATAEALDMVDVGPIAGIDFEGLGDIDATVKGPYENPVISGTTEMDDFAVMGHLLGETQGTVTYYDLILAVSDASIRRGLGVASAECQFIFRGEKPFVSGAADLEEIPVSDILATVGLESEQADHFDALVSGRAAVTGELLDPVGKVVVSTKALSIDGEPIGEIALDGGFGPSTGLWADYTVKPERGSAQGSVRLSAAGALDLSWRVEGLPLAVLTPFADDVDLEGDLITSGKLAGPVEKLSGELMVSLPRLTAFGLNLGRSRAKAEVSDGRMSISGTVLDGLGQLISQLQLGSQLPYSATVTLKDVDVGQVQPLPPDLHIELTGTLFSQGDLVVPEGLIADAEITSTEVRIGDIELRAERTWRLQYAGEVVMLSEVTLAGTDLNASAAGTISRSADAHLLIAAAGSLDKLRVLMPSAQFPAGLFEMRLNADGPLEQMSFDGQATIEGGAVRFARLDQSLADLNATLDFQGRTIRIASGEAKLGGGTLRFSGQALLPPEERAELNLQVHADSVTLRPSPELVFTSSGDLQLTGPVGDLLLKGAVKIDSLRYTANLDLESLIPLRTDAPIKVPIESEQAIHLAVRAAAPNNLIVSSNVLEAELQADIMVTGTSDRIGLVGSVTPLWARARYQDNLFQLERASILFTDEYRILTQFDLRATTEACGMRVAVDVQGNSDGWNVIPMGQDEDGVVDPPDVLTCLQTGLRLRDYRGLDAANLEENLSLSSLGAIWAVTGMDEKVKRFLPVVDEISLTSGWSPRSKKTTLRVVIRKELGSRLQLSYSRAIDELDDQILAGEYRLSPVASLEGTWNTASDVPVGDLGLDLRLRWELR